MNNKRYKLISAKLKGYMLIQYKDGLLNSLLFEFKEPLTEHQWYHLSNIVKPELKDLNEAAFVKAGLELIVLPVEDAPIAGNERIAIFCEYFEKETGIKYKVSRAAGAKMRDLPIGANEFAICIKAYFESKEWYLTPKSIENFCGKINEIRQLISSPAINKEQKKYPIPYDAEYAKRLNVGQLMEYQRVLREAGYRFSGTAGRGGTWIKATNR